MVSRLVSRLVSRAIHSPPPSIFRPLQCLSSFPNSDEKQCPGKMGALYSPNATISRWVHSVPTDDDTKGEDPPHGKMGDFKFYPSHYVFGFVSTPIIPPRADDTTSEEGNVAPSRTTYRMVPSIVPPDHPGLSLAMKQPKLKEQKGADPYFGGIFQDLKGLFKYEDRELESEEGLWELYRRWQLHFFGEYDSKEKRNSRTFKKFKKSAQFVYDLNKSWGFEEQAPFGDLAATYTPQELEKERNKFWKQNMLKPMYR